MYAALFAAGLFAVSAVCGHRSSKQIGGAEANLWRICLAACFLGLWAYTFGTGLEGAAFPLFLLSGFLGVGIGDTGFFQALPRLGSARTVLLVQCLTAPFAAVIEWLWLGTKLNLPEILCVAVILVGVAIALKPDDHMKISARDWQIGLVASVLGAFGAALGAVIIRKGYTIIQKRFTFDNSC